MTIFSKIAKAFGFDRQADDYDLIDDVDDAPLGYVKSRKPRYDEIEVEPEIVNEPVAPVEEETPVQPSERRQMMDEADRLSIALKKVTAERDSLQRKLLSAERQKRALSDRIYDFDQRFSEMESEKRRLEEENRRMRMIANKIDPSQVALDPAEDIDRLKNDIETLKASNQLADGMVKALTAKAATANRDAQEAREAKEIAEKQLEELKKELDDAHSEIEDAAKLIEQVQRMEEYKRRTDLRIAEMQRTIAVKDKEIRSLNSTIEHNLVKHAEAQQLLRREIESLRSGNFTGGDSAVPANSRKTQDEKPPRDKSRRKSDPEKDDSQLSLF